MYFTKYLLTAGSVLLMSGQLAAADNLRLNLEMFTSAMACHADDCGQMT